MMNFTDDRTSGSGDVAEQFLAELERWVTLDTTTSSHALRASLLGWLRAAQAAQPSMALIHQLAARALDVADAGAAREDSPRDLRDQLLRSVAAERQDLVAARAAVARTAVELLQGAGEPWIATLSNSATVREALRLAQSAGVKPRALVGEGRPRLEGRALAAALATGSRRGSWSTRRCRCSSPPPACCGSAPTR
jgi:translation initiation factor 2B subunit (eIF-2B alpha/beta/delta family)